MNLLDQKNLFDDGMNSDIQILKRCYDSKKKYMEGHSFTSLQILGLISLLPGGASLKQIKQIITNV
jgi:hypothetical protein